MRKSILKEILTLNESTIKNVFTEKHEHEDSTFV